MDEVDRMKNMARVEVIHPVKGHRFAIAVIQFHRFAIAVHQFQMYSTLYLYFIFVHRFAIALNQFVTYSTLYLYLKSTYSTKQVTCRYTNSTKYVKVLFRKYLYHSIRILWCLGRAVSAKNGWEGLERLLSPAKSAPWLFTSELFLKTNPCWKIYFCWYVKNIELDEYSSQDLISTLWRICEMHFRE